MKKVFETPEDLQTDGRSCSLIREDLKECLFETDCVRKNHKTPRECLSSKDPSVPERCHRLAYTFFECKRSILDNRVRFRGLKGNTNV